MVRFLRIWGAVLLVAVTALLAGGGPAAAAAGPLDMTWTPGLVTADFDPGHVAQRCPAGWDTRQAAILSAVGGVGELTYQGQTYAATVDQSHCSLPLPHTSSPADLLARDVTPIDIEAGRMTITTSVGQLFVNYRAPGVFRGDLTFVGYNKHVFNGPYTVTGGTGLFANAAGDGHLHGFAEGGAGAPVTGGLGTLNGSLRLAG